MKNHYINQQEFFSYSPNFLDEEIIEKILKIDNSGLSIEAAEKALKDVKMLSQSDNEEFLFSEMQINENDNYESVVNKVFDLMKADSEIGEEALKAKFTKDILSNTKSAIDNAAMLTEKVNQQMADIKINVLQKVKNACEQNVIDNHIYNANMASSNLSKTILEGKVTYKINDEVVFEYNLSAMSNKKASLFDLVISWAAVVADIFSIICTLAGIIAPKVTENILKKITSLLVSVWGKLKECFSFLGKMAGKGISEIKEIIKLLFDFFKLLGKEGTLLKDAIKAYFSELKWYDFVMDVISLIATIVLLIVSDGASLSLKLITLTAAFSILLIDIVKAVEATESV